VTDALLHGDLTVEGRMTDASNATLYCTAMIRTEAGDRTETCVYKPISGERPLGDFPDGTLAAREVAAYEVSAALGWNLVPTTVLRDGPFGPGMCQRWIHTQDGHDARLLAVLPEDGAHDGWCPVVAVGLADGTHGLLAHRDDPALRRVALFDVIINNADRKGGHLLSGVDGCLYAIDHGVSFHTEDKLRTLLWGFADRSLTRVEQADLTRVRTDEALAARLTELLAEREVRAFQDRVEALLAEDRLPNPDGRRRPVPWPLI
jgi:uncharacterized repeat protein (TIGR03843 family)